MKLKMYHKGNVKIPIKGKATVSISKSGNITFSKAAAAILDLKSGDKVLFGQDMNYQKDWYVAKDSKSDPLAWQIKDHGCGLQFTSKGLCLDIWGSLGIEAKSMKINMEKKPIEYDGYKPYRLETFPFSKINHLTPYNLV